jgi:hypothetical protein
VPIPSYEDPEGSPVNIVHYYLPPFITFVNEVYRIAPLNPMTDIRSVTIKGYLSDTNMQTDFSFSVYIFNEPPFFETSLRDQKLMLGYEADYIFPPTKDEEDLPFKVSLQTSNKEPLP